MKVLCAFKGSYPMGHAMANRLTCYADSMNDLGIEFTVASEGQKVKSKKRQKYSNHFVWHWRKPSQFDSIPIISGIYSLLIRYKLYFHILFNNDADIILSAGYKWPQMIAFSIICKLSKKKYIIELNELPHSIIASRLQTKFSNKIKRWITLYLAFPRINGFIVISENLGELAKKHCGQNAKIIKIPILTNEIQPLNKKAKGGLDIFHAGTLTTEKDGILTVFEAIGKARQESSLNIRFILSNYKALPSIKKKIESLIDKYEMKGDVIFHNYLNSSQLEEAYNSARLIIINKPNNLRNQYNFSTKLSVCMSYALPIISTSIGESKNYLVHEHNCMILKSSGDSNELSKLILRVFTSESLAENLGIEARKTAQEHFLYSKYNESFGQFLYSL